MGGGTQFDEGFARRVDEEVEEIENRDQERGEGQMNEPIQYQEVRKTIERLKNGKAAGIDHIVNEVIKYGGEQVHLVIWQLITGCFEK